MLHSLGNINKKLFFLLTCHYNGSSEVHSEVVNVAFTLVIFLIAKDAVNIDSKMHFKMNILLWNTKIVRRHSSPPLSEVIFEKCSAQHCK